MSVTLWFMGRPAAGKSTIASRVEEHLREQGLNVENLDGDEIRQNLHPDLGFSREDRATNNRRTAFICKLLNRNGIATVTGMITPFREAQQQARNIVEPDSEFVLIYVKCSLEEAKRRDPKGLYERAERGEIKKFTGVNHPFQPPHNPEVILDTEANSVGENVDHIAQYLKTAGLVEDTPESEYAFDLSGSEETEIKSRLEDLGYLE
jgi:adenylylsulfate kinase